MVTFDILIRDAAVLIEFGGSLVIAVACLRGLAAMVSGLGSHHAVVRGRLLVADGVVAALGYKTAATLLKTIELQAWSSIGMFAADPHLADRHQTRPGLGGRSAAVVR